MKKLTVKIIGEGPRMLMIHGWGMHAEIFSPLIPFLKEKFSLQLINLPGFGGQPGLVSDYELAALVDQIQEECDVPYYCLGWSLGGLLSYALAIRQAKNLLGLVQVATTPCFLAKPSWPGISETTFENFFQNLSISYEKTVNQFLSLQVLQLADRKSRLAQIKHYLQLSLAPPLEIMQASFDLLRTTDLREKLNQICCPVLAIYGRLDALVPVAVSELLPRYLPQVKTIVLPKATHIPFFSHPEEFACTVLTHL